MASNEIAERLVAACWVQCGGAGGEAINALNPTQIRFRSICGFQQEIITTTDALALPVLILPLDRTLVRSECAVSATRVATCGPFAGSREPYPTLLAAVPEVPQVFTHPIMLEWLGDDLSAPTFFPFGIINGTIPVVPPEGANLDQFDAICVLLPTIDADPFTGLAGDFCVVVMKHPPLEGDTALQPVLPVPPDDDIFALARAWFRADTYTSESGGEGEVLTALTGRVGIEGNLVPEGGSTSLPDPVPAFNGQDGLEGNTVFTSTQPPSFWNFLGSGQWTAYVVAAPINSSPSTVLSGAVGFALNTGADQATLEVDYSDPAVLDYSPGAELQLQWFRLDVDTVTVLPPGLLQLLSTFAGLENEALTGVPPGTVPATLTVGGGADIQLYELIFWNFLLDAAQDLEVTTYLTARYGVPEPEDPILALEPVAWFRGDSFTQSGGFTTALTGRVGTEGNLVPQIASYAVPAAVPAANNQLGLTYGNIANNNLVSSQPAAFWNFLATKDSYWSMVFIQPGVGVQTAFLTATGDVAFVVDTVTEQAVMHFGVGDAGAGPFSVGFAAANVGIKQFMQSVQADAAPQEITYDVTPGGSQNGGDWNPGEPPGTVGATLQLGNTTASAELGQIIVLDLVFFDRALTSGEIATWVDYCTARYGAF